MYWPAMNRLAKIGLSLLMLWCICPDVCAQQTGDVGTSSSTDTGNIKDWQHLETLVTTINNTREELAQVRAKLRASEDERERSRLTNEAEQLSLDLESLQTAWEMLATGGTDLRLFGVKTDVAFDWRDELQSVFEPVLVELKSLTEWEWHLLQRMLYLLLEEKESQPLQ